MIPPDPTNQIVPFSESELDAAEPPDFGKWREEMRAQCEETLTKQFSEEQNIVEFSKACGFNPYPYQVQAMTDMAQRKILLWGRRCGKTAVCSMIALWHCMFKEENVMIVSYNQDQARIMIREIRRWYRNYKYTHPDSQWIALKTDSARDIEFKKSGGHIMCRPAGPGVRGYAASVIIIDEASQVPAQLIQEEITPLAAVIEEGVQRQIMMISTPHARGSALYECWKNRNVWKTLGPVKTADCPRVDKAYLAAERESLPDAVYRQEYEAEWVNDLNNVFSIQDLDGCMMARSARPPSDYEATVIGVDLAKMGDYTTFTVLAKPAGYVMKLEEYSRMPYPEVAEKLRVIADRYKAQKILCDMTGIGEPIIHDILQPHIKQPIDGYIMTNQSKCDLVNNLRAMLEKRLLHIPNEKEDKLARKMYYQLAAYQYEQTAVSKVIRTTAPAGGHDDFVTSFCLAAWCLRPVGRITLLKGLDKY